MTYLIKNVLEVSQTLITLSQTQTNSLSLSLSISLDRTLWPKLPISTIHLSRLMPPPPPPFILQNPLLTFTYLLFIFVVIFDFFEVDVFPSFF